jgi:hypothetical protein
MQAIKKHLLAVLLIGLACNEGGPQANTKEPGKKTDSSAGVNPSLRSDTTTGGCYSQILNRDTATLQIEINENQVTGPLMYNIFEKDRNDGTLKAEIADSVIIGWYLFKSEGIISVRQVAWRIKPGQLWPATGTMIQRNDTMMFENPEKLEFDSERPFIKVKCAV